jgi:hypothetical protein
MENSAIFFLDKQSEEMVHSLPMKFLIKLVNFLEAMKSTDLYKFLFYCVNPESE